MHFTCFAYCLLLPTRSKTSWGGTFFFVHCCLPSTQNFARCLESPQYTCWMNQKYLFVSSHLYQAIAYLFFKTQQASVFLSPGLESHLHSLEWVFPSLHRPHHTSCLPHCGSWKGGASKMFVSCIPRRWLWAWPLVGTLFLIAEWARNWGAREGHREKVGQKWLTKTRVLVRLWRKGNPCALSVGM